MGRWSYSDRKTVEECESVSTFSLNKKGLFARDIQSTIISWTTRGGETRGSVGLQISMLKNDEHIRFQYTQTNRFSGQKTEFDYRVQLVSTPCYFGGHRWWFRCPVLVSGGVCGRRVGVLYSGEKRFGCRHCYNLTYDIQKEGHKFDKLFKSMGHDPKEARRALFRKRRN